MSISLRKEHGLDLFHAMNKLKNVSSKKGLNVHFRVMLDSKNVDFT